MEYGQNWQSISFPLSPLEASDPHQEKSMAQASTWMTASYPTRVSPMEQTHSREPIPADVQTHSNRCMLTVACPWVLECLFVQHYCSKRWPLWKVYMMENFSNSPNARTRHADIVLHKTSKDKIFLFGTSSVKTVFLVKMSSPSIAQTVWFYSYMVGRFFPSHYSLKMSYLWGIPSGLCFLMTIMANNK